jgi:hypothetical protein
MHGDSQTDERDKNAKRSECLNDSRSLVPQCFCRF